MTDLKKADNFRWELLVKCFESAAEELLEQELLEEVYGKFKHLAEFLRDKKIAQNSLPASLKQVKRGIKNGAYRAEETKMNSLLGIVLSDELTHMSADQLFLSPRSIRSAMELGASNLQQLQELHEECVRLVEKVWGPKDGWYEDTTPSIFLGEYGWQLSYMSASGMTRVDLYELQAGRVLGDGDTYTDRMYLGFVFSDHGDTVKDDPILRDCLFTIPQDDKKKFLEKVWSLFQDNRWAEVYRMLV